MPARERSLPDEVRARSIGRYKPVGLWAASLTYRPIVSVCRSPRIPVAIPTRSPYHALVLPRVPLEPLICDTCGSTQFNAAYRSGDMICVLCAECRTVVPVGLALDVIVDQISRVLADSDEPTSH